MKNLHFFTLLVSLILSSFLLGANGQAGNNPSPNPVNISKFNGIWSGFIATYPEGSKSTEICIKCDNVPQCRNNQILIQRTCTKCAYCVDENNTNIWDFVTDFFGGIINGFGNIASTLGINLQSASPSPSPATVTSSPEPSFSNIGGPYTKQISAGGAISLNLTVKNGDLKGTVQIGNLIPSGTIVSQNIISTDEIEINIKDKNGKAILLKLKLIGQPSFTGIFADGVLIEENRFTPFYSYLVPSKTISMPQSQPSPPIQPSPSIQRSPSPKPTPSPSPKPQPGRPGGTGRPGGENGGRAGGESGGRAGGEDGGRAGGDSDGRAGGESGGRAGGEDEEE